MPQVITTILLEDSPYGLRLIEIAGWSGRIYVTPRIKLKEFSVRPNVQQPGLYVLLGESDAHPTAYIGQSENVSNRLMSHDAKKEADEWDVALVFVGGLDSTLIKRLEHLAIHQAKNARRYELKNSVTPTANTTSEAQQIVVSDYFQKVRMVVEMLGYTLFEDSGEGTNTSVLYYFKTDKAHARGVVLNTQEFMILKGSTARVHETMSFGTTGKALRKKLIDDGILVADSPDSYIFTQDKIFSSPSSAADAVAGRSCNGWTAWKDDVGNTLDENLRR